MSKKHSSVIMRVLISKKTTVILGIGIVLVGFGLVKYYNSQKDISRELASLEKNVAALENKKLELARLIDIYKTSEYIEREARLRLGLKKQGEQVVSIPESARAREKILGAAVDVADRPHNLMLWFEYFFGAQ